MVNRGDIHWVDFGAPVSSAPAKRRPVVIVQSDRYNWTRLATVVVAVLTSNTEVSRKRGNVFLPSAVSGLPKDSVVNVTGLVTVDRAQLDPYAVGSVPGSLMSEVDDGLREVLDL